MEEKHPVAPYVIVTPARNEEALIERTIASMISQTVRPLLWIVVNDGSTDRTGELLAKYAARYAFLHTVTLERPGGRHFGNKAQAFNRGLADARLLPYRFVGNLDADISLEKDYFEKLLQRFAGDPCLGLAGGMVASRIRDTFVSQEVAPDSVAGAVQLFRRECFEEVGGYQCLPLGGIDSAAEIVARMKGWKVQTFPDLRVLEHRRTGSATARPLASMVREGQRLQALGYGFAFMCLRCMYRTLDRPRLIGSAAMLYGYIKNALRGAPRAAAGRGAVFAERTALQAHAAGARSPLGSHGRAA